MYCAGPLFTEKEREEMAEIASRLEQAGFDTFLPQRDGLELTKCLDSLVTTGLAASQASEFVSRAIFALDVYQVLEACHATLVNLNGRVPDEGAIAEAAMAWSAGKTVVGYKADSRSVFGGADNPLVAGLFGFELTRSIPEAVAEVRKAADEGRIGPGQEFSRKEELRGYLRAGREIYAALERSRDPNILAEVLMQEFSRVRASL